MNNKKPKKLTVKELDSKIRSMVKEFTDSVKQLEKESDMILSVKVIIEVNKPEKVG